MKIQIQPWTIQEVIDSIDIFVLNPKYQRLPVWKAKRKALLIDSILRGYDLPKFYIKMNLGQPITWEVTDGQQRIRAILEYFNDEFNLLDNTIIAGKDMSASYFSGLPNGIQKSFLKFTLTFSEILKSEEGEVNELFARLQKGVPLNEVELRHAMFSNFGFKIDELMQDSHILQFFADSKITNTRFKHQDFIDHAVAIAITNGEAGIKADVIRDLYKTHATSDLKRISKHFMNTKKVIRKMAEINSFNEGLFRNKWSFVDAFWLLLDHVNALNEVDSEAFSDLFTEFNNYRVLYRSEPQIALRSRSIPYGKFLFDYILAFEKEAATRDSLIKRKVALQESFSKLI